MASHPKPNPARRRLSVQDPTRRAHFLHAANLGSATQRFESFQAWVLDAAPGCLEPSSLVLACLLSFEGLVSENSLRSAYLACSSAGTDGPALRIDWLEGSRIDARHLSGPTVVARRKVKDWTSFDCARDGLTAVLQSTGFVTASGVKVLWDQLQSWAISWCQDKLVPIFYGHVTGIAPVSALPRTALARAAKQMALKLDGPLSDDDTFSRPRSYERAFEAAMLGRPPSMLSGSSFIKKLKDALRPPAKGSLATRRNAVLDALGLLAAEVDQLDEVCALLYIFSLDLVENGTRRKNRLAPTTPYDYVNSFALEFHTEAAGLRLSDIDLETYSKIYVKLLGSAKTASYLLAGAKAFHLFLRGWWFVPKLPLDVFQVDVDAQVSANVLWPHELQLLQTWIRQVEPSRFSAQLVAAFAITGYSMIRISELRVLRLLNLVYEGDQLVIEVARAISDGKEKSAEGRRRIYIRDPEAISKLRQWRTRRIDEGAGPNDYVFGDPGDARRLAQFGKTYFWMNRLLKDVSGEQGLSVHSLRHSHASFRFVAILLDRTESEINQMDVLATEAGHSGAHVTVANYCHIFEALLRYDLDQHLAALPVGYGACALWSGLPQGALRQRVSRRSAPRSRILWEAIDARAPRLQSPAVGDAVLCEQPVNSLLSLNAGPLAYHQVLGLLTDIARGLSVNQASLRQDLSDAVVVAALKSAGEFAQQHGTHEDEFLDELSLGAAALQDTSGRLLGFKPDFARAIRSRWAGLIKAIDTSDTLHLGEACRYWCRALTAEHLAVRPGPGWDKFLALLRHANLNAGLISLRVASGSEDESGQTLALAKAQAAVRIVFGRTVRVVEQARRGGRPSICLSVCGDPRFLDIRGSAHSLVGLHCCLLAAHVWQALTIPIQERKI